MRTIAEIIQYLMLKLMKRLRPQDDNRPFIATANHLLDKLIPSAFRLFHDARFRKEAGFEKLDQIEHDRIFNELEVAAICLSLFCLEERNFIIGERDFHFWKSVREQIPVQFEEKLLNLGLDKNNAKLFKDLIGIRHREYQKIRAESHDFFDEQQDLKNARPSAKASLERVQAIIIGTVDHIRRGKMQQGDTLFPIMRSWLFPLDMKINKFIRKL